MKLWKKEHFTLSLDLAWPEHSAPNYLSWNSLPKHIIIHWYEHKTYLPVEFDVTWRHVHTVRLFVCDVAALVTYNMISPNNWKNDLELKTMEAAYNTKEKQVMKAATLPLFVIYY